MHSFSTFIFIGHVICEHYNILYRQNIVRFRLDDVTETCKINFRWYKHTNSGYIRKGWPKWHTKNQLRHHKFELTFVRIYTITIPTGYKYKCKFLNIIVEIVEWDMSITSIRYIIFQTAPHFCHKLHLIHIRYTYMKAILLSKKCKCMNLHWVYEVHIKKVCRSP